MKRWRRGGWGARAPAAVILALLIVGTCVPGGRAQTGSSAGLSPGLYFQLVLERQKLEISSCQQILRLLDSYGGDVLRAWPELKKHEQERQRRQALLFQKYGISAEEYYRDSRGTPLLRQRSLYLDAHPEIRDQLAANSRELTRLLKEIDLRMALSLQPRR